jgi:hypothetical protein
MSYKKSFIQFSIYKNLRDATMPIKDDHFELDSHKFPLFAEDLTKLHSTLSKDTQFLSQNELGEYSLLIGVHNKSTIL